MHLDSSLLLALCPGSCSTCAGLGEGAREQLPVQAGSQVVHHLGSQLLDLHREPVVNYAHMRTNSHSLPRGRASVESVDVGSRALVSG